MAFNFFNNTLANNLSKTNKNINRMQNNDYNINQGQDLNQNMNNISGFNFSNPIGYNQNKPIDGLIKTMNQSFGVEEDDGNQIMGHGDGGPDQGGGGGVDEGPGTGGWTSSQWIDFFEDSNYYSWNPNLYSELMGLLGDNASSSEILNWASNNFYNFEYDDSPIEEEEEESLAFEDESLAYGLSNQKAARNLYYGGTGGNTFGGFSSKGKGTLGEMSRGFASKGRGV
tara:strand:- start:1319 stop:1999 length:681 start_codon:yes stop_codon:yes gene_type:complete